MKSLKKILIFLITTTFSFSVYAQVADSVYYQRLYYTCKVWGHAKYYHSRIAEGFVNWDDVLLNTLPNIKNAPDNQAFNDALLTMLQQAGETQVGTGTLPEIPDSLNNNKDITWIYHPIFSNDVSMLLDTIIRRFTPKSNVYVGHDNSDVPNFSNYDTLYYSSPQYPEESKRILGIFRYWNIIHYFFPYKYIMDQPWDTTLMQNIHTVVNASSAMEYHLAMRVFTAKINDTHAAFSSSTFTVWKGNAYTPFQARLIEGKVVITKVLFSNSGLFSGDVIKKIDGLDIDHLRDSLRKYSYGSNDISIEKNLIDIILWGEPDQFSLTVLNETGEHTLDLIRQDTYYWYLLQDDAPSWRKVTLNKCRFGIVNMGKLTTAEFPEIIDKFHEVDAIIFDIRNYPNGTLWTLVNYFFETPIHIANFTFPNIEYPGILFWYEEVIGHGISNPLQKKVMILFDERTLSQAEYTCMGLEQIPGAVKIGSTTAAADGNVAAIYLPGGIMTTATFLGCYYPDYTPTQRVGIIPDYEVRPTIQGIREKRDEVMEFALDCKWLETNDIEKNGAIIIYPNPTSGELRIENGELRIENVEVFDIFGRTVGANLCVRPHTVIDISHLPAGVYIIKISANGNIYTYKIVKYSV